MRASEIADLLIINAGLDPFTSVGRQSEERAVVWAKVLSLGAPGITYAEAEHILLEHYVDATKSITPADIVAKYRAMRRLRPDEIRGDVRSARARGLIAADWPESRPVPPNVAAALATIRSGENRVMRELGAPDDVE